MERIRQDEVPQNLLTPLLKGEEIVAKSGLDHRLLELMRVRVSQINGCAHCLDMHYKTAVHLGESAQRLISVSAWRETPYYSEKERAVLAFAERMTLLYGDDHIEDIHEDLLKHFTKDQIAWLTLAVVLINGWNRLVRSFGPTPGNYKVPDQKATAGAAV